MSARPGCGGYEPGRRPVKSIGVNFPAFKPARGQPRFGRIALFEQTVLWLERTDARIGYLIEGKAHSARNRSIAALTLYGIASVSPLQIA